MSLAPRTYWTLFGLLLLGSVFGTNLADRRMGSRARFLIPPKPQTADLRVNELQALEPSQHRPSLRLSDGSPIIIRAPVRIEASPDGALFVIEDGEQGALTELDPAAGETTVVHQAKRPRSMKSITDIAFQSDEVWVADLLGSSIHVLDRNTGRWRSTKWYVEPYRLEPTVSAPGRLLVNRVGTPYLFDVMTPRGEILQSFGLILQNQHYHALLLDGFIVRSGPNILYCGQYVGVLASFSENGQINWLASSIVPPKPPVLMDRKGIRWVNHSPLDASLSVAATEDWLYVLSRRTALASVRSYIDVYSTHSGEYSMTLGLPQAEHWTSVAIGSDILYVASEHRIVQWWPERSAADQAEPLWDDRGRTLIDLMSPRDRQHTGQSTPLTRASTDRHRSDQPIRQP